MKGHIKGDWQGRVDLCISNTEYELNNNQRWKRRRKELKRTVDGDVSYLAPPVNSLADGKPTKLWTVPTLAMERPTTLGRVDDLIQFDKLHHDEKTRATVFHICS